MKRLSIFFVACAMMVACAATPADKAAKKAIEMLDAVKVALDADDFAKAEELTKQIEEWELTLTDEEKAAVEKASAEWVKDSFSE
ncbi:MAG: hypothetical protein IKA81_05580 [Alistipes sp.]|nr:hypothetical protein [Alistipes sp.]